HATRVHARHRRRQDPREGPRSARPAVRSSDHEERRRAVIDPARARRRDGAALAKRRLELRDGLEGRARTGILVLGERRPVGKGDGNQFVDEHAILEPARGAPLALHGELVPVPLPDGTTFAKDEYPRAGTTL